MSPHCCLLPLRVQETPWRGLERQAGAGHCSETMLLAWVIDREICQLAAGLPPYCPHSPRSGTVPLAGTCWRAWSSPALLRDPLTWKLLVYMDSSRSKRWEQQREQQGSLYLSKLLPHTSVSSSSNTLEQRILPMAGPPCRVPQISVPSRCCIVCHGRAPMGTAPLSFSALPEHFAVSCVSGLPP